MKQGSEEWLRARLGKATASKFADIMANGRGGNESAARKNYRAKLVVERLTGIIQEEYTNGAMEFGTETEPLARAAYEAETGNLVIETGLVLLPGNGSIGASPDGLIGEDGGVEIKCPNTATHIENLLCGVPSKYRYQIQGCMWVTGRKWWDFVSFDPRMPESLQIIIHRVQRDEECIAKLSHEVNVFLAEVDELEQGLLRLASERA